MSVTAWIVVFLISSLFWAWLLFWGGANWLEGSWIVAVVVHFRAVEWTADGIRLFALLMWALESVWFVTGLFVPGVRFWP